VPYIIAACIASVPASVSALAAWRSSKRLRSDMHTNHGKRPGEYLELTADIHKLLVDHITDNSRHLN